MNPSVLVILYTYDRYGVLKPSLESMFRNPGMDFKFWLVENGSAFSNLYGDNSGLKQFDYVLDLYKKGKIETVILNDRNVGIHHALNQLMALSRLQSGKPSISIPDYICYTNDDMLYEDNWLLDTYTALIDCADYNKGKIAVASPFHCVHMGSRIPPFDSYKGYEIIDSICGNVWFMESNTWLDTFSWYPTDDPVEGGDWNKLNIMKKLGWHSVMTREEKAHHSEEATGCGKYNRLDHW